MKSKWRCLERCRMSWWRSRPGGQGRRPERNDGVVDPLFEVAPVNKQASVGIEFRYDLQTRTPNTFDSHQLVWPAGTSGVQDAVVEALFRAYFCEGVNFADPQKLLKSLAKRPRVRRVDDIDLIRPD